MATYQKFQQTVEDWLHGVYQADTDQFVVALCNAANPPSSANDAVLADLTTIAYTNLSSRNLTTTSSSQTGGVYTQLYNTLVLTAGGGSVAPFRYVVIYNDTPTSPTDPLLCFYDNGSEITLNDTDSLTINFTTATFTVT